MTNPLKTLLFLLFVVCHSARLLAQDPFFTHFPGNEALFNPALTGLRGATSISMKGKQQWQSAQTEGYQTMQLVYEESMPCSFFDYGLSVIRDTEGAGRLRTHQFGGMLAAPLRLDHPLDRNQLQLRLGLGLHWGQQAIDFDRLLFIDQLHPKYGLTGPDGQPIASAFTPPADGGGSSVYFQPSGGVALRYVVNPRSKQAFTLVGGVAAHNLVPWDGAENSGHSWSLLGLGTPTIPRFTMFLNADIVTGDLGNHFFSLRPQVFAQTQRGIAYLEGGVDLSLSRQYTAGFYWHASRPDGRHTATNWGSFRLETGFFTSRTMRIDLGISYAYNVSGLRNAVNDIYELTVRFNFLASPMCSLSGRPVENGQPKTLKCPTLSERGGRKKIYENIWYNSQN